MLEEPKKASHAERERGHAFLGQADFRSAVYFTELTHTEINWQNGFRFSL